MRLNREQPPQCEGPYDWIDGQRHIISEQGASSVSLCGLPLASPFTTHYFLYQHECCPRCWQRWRREQGTDVRDAWKDTSDA